jgi:hypothetical protein
MGRFFRRCHEVSCHGLQLKQIHNVNRQQRGADLRTEQHRGLEQLGLEGSRGSQTCQDVYAHDITTRGQQRLDIDSGFGIRRIYQPHEAFDLAHYSAAGARSFVQRKALEGRRSENIFQFRCVFAATAKVRYLQVQRDCCSECK